MPGISSTPSILVVFFLDGREADAAIAEQHGGGAMPGRRRQHRVPGRLTVVMGVDVDPAGGDDMACGVDVAPCRSGLAADRDDLVAVDGDVAGERRTAGAVHDCPAADDQVMHRVNAPSDGVARCLCLGRARYRIVSPYSRADYKPHVRWPSAAGTAKIGQNQIA
jgi:hypothetical protein